MDDIYIKIRKKKKKKKKKKKSKVVVETSVTEAMDIFLLESIPDDATTFAL